MVLSHEAEKENSSGKQRWGHKQYREIPLIVKRKVVNLTITRKREENELEGKVKGVVVLSHNKNVNL